MEKPISIIINDTKTELRKVCAESKLPSCILECLVKDLYNEIHALSVQQLNKDQIIYQQSLVNKNKEETGEPKGIGSFFNGKKGGF